MNLWIFGILTLLSTCLAPTASCLAEETSVRLLQSERPLAFTSAGFAESKAKDPQVKAEQRTAHQQAPANAPAAIGFRTAAATPANSVSPSARTDDDAAQSSSDNRVIFGAPRLPRRPVAHESQPPRSGSERPATEPAETVKPGGKTNLSLVLPAHNIVTPPLKLALPPVIRGARGDAGKESAHRPASKGLLGIPKRRAHDTQTKTQPDTASVVTRRAAARAMPHPAKTGRAETGTATASPAKENKENSARKAAVKIGRAKPTLTGPGDLPQGLGHTLIQQFQKRPASRSGNTAVVQKAPVVRNLEQQDTASQESVVVRRDPAPRASIEKTAARAQSRLQLQNVGHQPTNGHDYAPATVGLTAHAEQNLALPVHPHHAADCRCSHGGQGFGSCPVYGVHCDECGPCNSPGWKASQQIPWETFAQGEYIGPARLAHVPQYYLRVDDEIEVVYFISRQKQSRAYKLGVGDNIQIESLSVETINREVEIQPDGNIVLPQVGEVPAADYTIEELRNDLDKRYKAFINNPQINVTPRSFNAGLTDIISSVDRRGGVGGQSQRVRVTPEGTVQLPGIGSVYVQGLNLPEMEREVEAHYAAKYGEGLDVTPILRDRAPRFVYVVGEVRLPGRYTLEAPTTVMQAVALAGGWNVGARLHQVVIFRRDDNWRLMATKVNLRDALYGHEPCPAGELWLRDSDIVLIPKQPVLIADEAIELLFTRGLYQVFPVSFGVSWSKLSSI